MRIFLLGYMGSGKSKVGGDLARKMNYPFIDLDDVFEERYRISVLGFFEKYNEEIFRKLEQKLLQETTATDDVVVSTGGGTPCFFDNMDFIKANGISFYLKPDTTTLVERLRHVKKKRPLLSRVPSPEFENFVMEQLAIREPFYLRADHVIDGGDINADRLLKIIMDNRS
jgi:shikimate kinase